MKIFRNLLSVESFIVSAILLLAGFLRLYRVGEYLTFLGDEGRDALIVKGILEGNFTLLGPRASAGDFFLGPIYYYFMAPFLWIFHFDPVGPAIMVALFGIVTVGLVYYIGKKFFGTFAGIFAAALYAVSPVVIAYSRSSWNPNLVPFFSVVILLLLYMALRAKRKYLFFLVGVLFGIIMQLHYLATFLGIIMIAYIFFAEFFVQKSKSLGKVGGDLLLICIGFLMGFSPFLAFEIRHGFPNIKTIFSFIFQNTLSTGYSDGVSFFAIVFDVFFRLFGRLVTRFPPPEQVSVQADASIALWFLATLVLALLSIGYFILQLFHYVKKRDEEKLRQYGLIALWLFLGVLLFGFYKKTIYDYYFGFLFPLPFLLIGNFLNFLTRIKKIRVAGIITCTIIFSYLLLLNLKGAPFFSSPNRQKDQVKMISDFVLSQTGREPYNFALITGGNSDHAYRYFLELAGSPPVVIESPIVDPERESITDQLLVVCEDVQCQPLGNSLWEVAGFGRAEIVGEWNVSVVKVYKLQHYAGR